jgi:SAM-dependent methyltransferase
LKGKELMHLLEEFLHEEMAPFPPTDTTSYDNLDLFVNGILTFRELPVETRKREPDMVYYQKTPARIILKLIRQAELAPQDVFFDLGSGMGQVSILVNLLGSVISKGVEFEPSFCDYAKKCASDLQLHDVNFTNIDARSADYSSGTVFFMYTPFEGKMLLDVLERLRNESKKRKIKLFTYGPCTVVVAKQDWLLNRRDIQYGPGVFGEFLSRE